MASENETIEDIVTEMRDEFPPKYCSSKHCRVEIHQPVRSFANRIEAANKREVAEMKKLQCPKNFKCDSLTEMLETVRQENSELRLALSVEKARHTPDYKDERIRSQDAEIATLKRENTELSEMLKSACDTECAHRNCLSFRDGKCHGTYDCGRMKRWRKALKGESK